MTKPIKVWITPSGPNPWKPVLILEELGVPYELETIEFKDVKTKPFIDINPNGRVPAIQDPNTDLTLWESGAIIEYLIEHYDTEKKLTHEGLKERALEKQWLFFQVSGQGPYFGQAAWFNVLHSERVQSAIDRYNAEMLRILGVLEQALEGNQWLVGDKITYADLAFCPWNNNVEAATNFAIKKWDGFPNVGAWHERMTSRPSWKKCMEMRAKLMDQQGLQWNGMPKGVNNMDEYKESLAKEAV